MFKVLLISALLWTRWLISTLPGYIHPDEFFQNPEITSSKIFGIETFTPWEYTPEHASRSIIAP
jgi:phosphatidylinositol glycan class Z